jgi:hypothetical protein
MSERGQRYVRALAGVASPTTVRVAELTQVKLMSDYYAESPLWADNVMIDPERLDLSAELSTGLLAWQAHFHHEAGWHTTADRRWYSDQVDDLVRSLRKELPAGATLDIDVWPLEA